MTAQQIIDNIFHLYTDDTTELSGAEELLLLNRIYQKICSTRPYEFLKTNATGVITNGQITLPADFLYLTENSQKTDIAVGQGESVSKVVYVGLSYTPYKVINFSDRANYREADGYCYLDLANSKIVFPNSLLNDTYDFDYIKIPADLAVGDSPVFPSPYHSVIGYGMAIDGFAIQLFDKAKSYAQENQAKYNSLISDLNYYNANLRCE